MCGETIALCRRKPPLKGFGRKKLENIVKYKIIIVFHNISMKIKYHPYDL